MGWLDTMIIDVPNYHVFLQDISGLPMYIYTGLLVVYLPIFFIFSITDILWKTTLICKILKSAVYICSEG